MRGGSLLGNLEGFLIWILQRFSKVASGLFLPAFPRSLNPPDLQKLPLLRSVAFPLPRAAARVWVSENTGKPPSWTQTPFPVSPSCSYPTCRHLPYSVRFEISHLNFEDSEGVLERFKNLLFFFFKVFPPPTPNKLTVMLIKFFFFFFEGVS